MKITVEHDSGVEVWVVTDRGATPRPQTRIAGDDVHTYSVEGRHPDAPPVSSFQCDRATGRHALASRAMLGVLGAHRQEVA